MLNKFNNKFGMEIPILLSTVFGFWLGFPVVSLLLLPSLHLLSTFSGEGDSDDCHASYYHCLLKQDRFKVADKSSSEVKGQEDSLQFLVCFIHTAELHLYPFCLHANVIVCHWICTI